MQVDPLRRFYSSLHEQIPESDMAKKWCAPAPADDFWLYRLLMWHCSLALGMD